MSFILLHVLRKQTYINIDTNYMQQQRFINNSNQLNIFQATISPIRRSTRLCLQLVV